LHPPPPVPPAPPREATGPIRIVSPPQVSIAGAISLAEKHLTPEQGRQIQAALCLKPDSGTVTFGRATRAAIEMFRTVPSHKGPTDDLTTSEAISLTTAAPCDTKQFANAFEYFEYRTDERGTSAERIRRLQAILRDKVPPGKTIVPDTGQFDQVTRTAIGDIQQVNGRTPTGQVTRDFLDLLQ
jgi:peptidoglycan hydrolase-like protein with peptidoglycan-binding domain